MDLQQLFAKSLAYIEQNLEQSIDLTDISNHSGYSKYYFSRMFKVHFGLSVMDYVRKRRLARACDEILSGSRILDVALRYGYESHGGFAKAFRQEYGFSPSLLRGMSLQMKNLGGNVMEAEILRQIDEHADKEKLFSILKEEIQKANNHMIFTKLENIYSYACKAYEGKKRYSGDEYITHPLNVAIILAQMEAEEHVIFTGMLCDVLQKTKITPFELPTDIDGNTRKLLERLHIFDRDSINSWDEEVLMVKIAQRLHNMRTLSYMEEYKRSCKAKETIQMFLPIAKKLGNHKLTKELKELSLIYL